MLDAARRYVRIKLVHQVAHMLLGKDAARRYVRISFTAVTEVGVNVPNATRPVGTCTPLDFASQNPSPLSGETRTCIGSRVQNSHKHLRFAPL